MIILRKILTLLLSAMITFFPSLGTIVPDGIQFKPKDEEVLLNAMLISDIHIDYRELVTQSMLSAGLSDLKLSDPAIDCVVVAGDLTNYGDEKSMDTVYDIFDKYSPCEKWVLVTGNHDIGHVDDELQEQARQHFIQNYNSHFEEQISKIYYSTVVNGYRFIILGDESDDSWDFPLITEEQLNFVDSELNKSAQENMPAFVVCHWPITGTNGQETVWEDGSIREVSDSLRAILEKYKNVFYISGHMHEGINSKITQTLFGVSSIETKNGVNYINLPTFALVNRYGIPWGGTGFQMEVYSDKVLFRTRNYDTSTWYTCYEFSVDLV